jgi:hypothetical protein
MGLPRHPVRAVLAVLAVVAAVIIKARPQVLAAQETRQVHHQAKEIPVTRGSRGWSPHILSSPLWVEVGAVLRQVEVARLVGLVQPVQFLVPVLITLGEAVGVGNLLLKGTAVLAE